MRSMSKPDPGDWLIPAFGLVAAITVARLVLLAFNRTDLYVDESQYWLWGQDFAFGYYSKPPLIAWVIGGVTWLAGSDAPFWVRAPFAVFHGAAALILAALAARLHGPRVAVLVAASYATLPMVAVGSLLASTDTIMAPFFAGAIYFHARLLDSRMLRFAILAGALAGLACLAKYAGVYFLLGVSLGAVLIPTMRLSARQFGAMFATFAVVISPNILWNLSNGMATVSHTMDNIGWVRDDAVMGGINPAGLAEFFFSQFAVFGPVLFAALLVATRTKANWRLLVFVIPAIVIVCGQALMDRAYANWAASAYFAGTVVAVAVLASRPKLMTASLVINSVIAVILPLLTLMPGLTLGRSEPLVMRYLGQAALSRQILDLATQKAVPVVAARRDVLADLFYTGRDAGISIYAVPPEGRPQNHYEQRYPAPSDLAGRVLFVAAEAPACPGSPSPEVYPLDRAGGAYAKVPLSAFLMSAECL
jgi:4-amino-4-deoxy-L-arabinose transferase-like glycosyltransferase